MLALDLWPRLTVEDFPQPDPNLVQALVVRFPDPEVREARAVQINSAQTGSPAAMVGEGVTFADLPRDVPSSLRARWSLPAQRLDLTTLARKLAEDGGPKLEVSEYARRRKVWVCSSSGTRYDVLSALADLWGWQLSLSHDGFYLGRPRLAPATDALDLHRKLRAAFPPALWHTLHLFYHEGARAWYSRHMHRIWDGAQKVGGRGWKKVELSQLDADSQDCLAFGIAFLGSADWFKINGDRVTAYPWLVHPELGVLKLSGPIEAGKHPLLSFEATDDAGKPWMWGYYVGTSSLAK